MSSRETILSAISRNKPAALPLPDLPAEPLIHEHVAKVRKFISMLEFIGGTVVETENNSLVRSHFDALLASGKAVASMSVLLGSGNVPITAGDTAPQLEAIDTAFIDGSWGVAENGAVWLYESHFKNRLLPFICQHLVILLSTSQVLSDMHEAYRRIDISSEGYGLFLAGPSKTADIEQSLVIGAHGARSCTVYLQQG